MCDVFRGGGVVDTGHGGVGNSLADAAGDEFIAFFSTSFRFSLFDEVWVGDALFFEFEFDDSIDDMLTILFGGVAATEGEQGDQHERSKPGGGHARQCTRPSSARNHGGFLDELCRLATLKP